MPTPYVNDRSKTSLCWTADRRADQPGASDRLAASAPTTRPTALTAAEPRSSPISARGRAQINPSGRRRWSWARRATTYRTAVPVHFGVAMCHYDEVVRSVTGSSAERLTARGSRFRPGRYPAPAMRAARAAIVPCTTTRRSATAGQGDDRAGLTVGIDPAAYWEHGPDHRDNPRRDPRYMASCHGCGRDRGHPQDVSHHRTDRDGRLHRCVARGQAPSSRLARHSRRSHRMRAAAQRCPAGPQALGSLSGNRLPEVITGRG